MNMHHQPRPRAARLAIIAAVATLAIVLGLQARAATLGAAGQPGAAEQPGATGQPAAAPRIAFKQTAVAAADATMGDNFGYSAALDGNTLVVGAYLAGANGKEKAGAVYVFTRPAADSSQWSQVARLTAADGAAFDQFGTTVAVDGDTIAVTALLADINGNTNQGAVYLFGRNQGGTNKWGQVKKLVASDGNGFDEFGHGLIVDGDELLVAAQAADANSFVRNGAVYVFRRNQGGANNWGEADILFDPNGRDSDNFGADIALAGNWLVVGADRADVTGNFENDGAALLFSRTGPGANWTYVRRLVADDAKPNEQFGGAVAIAGDRVLVGAPAAGRNGQFSVGKAYLFGRNQGGANNWGQIKLLTASNGTAFDNFGVAVAMDGDTAYVAANAADVAIADEGAVYIYQKDQGGANAWDEALKLGATGGAPNANFGRDVTHASGALVVGANLADSAKGKAYVYTPAAPAQPSQLRLPVIFDVTFTPTAVLRNGSTVTTPEGVKLGAVAGALGEELPISIDKVPPPTLPVPDRATVIGDYFRIAAARETIQPLEKSFILGLPVPAGANTDNLAVAVLGSTASLLDMENDGGAYWGFAPGNYDATNNLLLVQFPYLSEGGETVVMVEHPDMTSPANSRARAGEEPVAANFIAACTQGPVCNDAIKKEVADQLQIEFADFMNNYGYGYPRMQGNGSDLSLDPPALNVPSQFFFAFIVDDTKPGCVDEAGKTAYAGQYSPSWGSLHICVPVGTTSLTPFQKLVVRHEYFHALEFSYNNVLSNWQDDTSENWIIEGMADVVTKSGQDWKRSGTNEIRPVDKRLREDDGKLEYQAEDFWAYYGRNRTSGGIERLRSILVSGATFYDVFNNTGFMDDYWLWVRNQALEKSDNLDGALKDGKCKLEEAVATRMFTWEIDNPPTNNPIIGTVDPLSAYIVELDFDDSYAGREIGIYVSALPKGQPPPIGFEYKIYRTPWPNCSGTPDNTLQVYKIVPGERYFVLFANWWPDKVIPWEIGIE